MKTLMTNANANVRALLLVGSVLLVGCSGRREDARETGVASAGLSAKLSPVALGTRAPTSID